MPASKSAHDHAVELFPGTLSSDIEQEILNAIRRIDYGSVEIVVHNSRVVQIECREKIRFNSDAAASSGLRSR